MFLEILLSLIICLSQFIDGVGVKAFPKNFNNLIEKLKINGYNKIVKIQDIENIIEI